eukprot:gnl/Chilomastix_caulleri/6871.p1 GENE.gnl/Chilomastix_caulleri/6871~~gnl/Chilomastix_caulleri/6871.p1  ORF type:complete len:154 (-),score=36.98 gnl/Chilomastix_caulleri/6871:32-493(-)
MSSSDEAEFEGTGAPAGSSSETYPLSCNLCKKGGYIVMQGRPCKIVDKNVAKTGKHGGAKARITAIDIFTDKKYEDIIPTSHNCDVPNVKTTTYPVMLIDEDHVEFMLEDGSVRDDYKNDPEDPVCRDLYEAYKKLSPSQEISNWPIAFCHGK